MGLQGFIVLIVVQCLLLVFAFPIMAPIWLLATLSLYFFNPFFVCCKCRWLFSIQDYIFPVGVPCS